LQAERLDLLQTGSNNATSTFQKMGLYPYDPNCESWSGAIKMLGLGNNDNKAKVQYEIYPTEPERQLTVNEEKILHDGMMIDPKDDKTGITANVGVAFTRAEHVLARWHDDIEQAVSEGEQYEQYANIYLPKAKTEAEKIALTLVHFKMVKFDSLPKNSVEQNVVKGEEITRNIVTSTQTTEPIRVVAYLANNSEDSDSNSDDSSGTESVPGMAVENSTTTWTVIL